MISDFFTDIHNNISNHIFYSKKCRLFKACGEFLRYATVKLPTKMLDRFRSNEYSENGVV